MRSVANQSGAFAANQELLRDLTAGLEANELTAFKERLSILQASQATVSASQLQLAEADPLSSVRRRGRARFSLPQRRARELILSWFRSQRLPNLVEPSVRRDDEAMRRPTLFDDVQACGRRSKHHWSLGS